MVDWHSCQICYPLEKKKKKTVVIIIIIITGNRMFLGFAGVLAAGLSIVAAFGLVSACGMKFVSIVGNVPFLIIG